MVQTNKNTENVKNVCKRWTENVTNNMLLNA